MIYSSLANLHDKEKYVLHVRNSKQALNHGLKLENVHRLIRFNEKAWLKSYRLMHMNTELKKNAKQF